MNLKLGEYNKYFVIALLVILTFCFSLFIKKENFKQNILLFFTFSISTFVLFKQSFVRSDLHVAIFFTFFPAICGLTILFYHKHSFTKLAIALLICLVCLVTEFSLISPPKFSDRLNYLRAVANPEDISERVAKDYDRFKLPQEVKNIIGDKTVDIIPWTINYIYFNNLNYNPRPIIQSYSVYTPYLMKLNRQKYDSETAPEFVIYSHTSIDWRYPLFDDQEAKLSLIQNYKCLGLYNTQNSDFLLFQRKPNLNKIVFSGQGEDTVKLGENYFLKDPNKSYFIKIGLDYTYLGKAVRFLYKPFPVSIVFTLEDNTERAYRAVLPIIKNGVLINPLIEEPKDFLNFVDGSPINTNKKIKAFRIEYESPSKSTRVMAPFTYVQEIKLSVSEFSFSKNEQ